MRTLPIMFAFSLVVGCSPDPDPGPDPDPADIGCPDPTGEVIVHTGDLTADETWAGDGTVHHVTFHVTLRASTLTLEPCAVVQFDAGYGIELRETVDGPSHLVARGTATQPILLERTPGAGPWGSLLSYDASSSMELAHVSLLGGGALSDRGMAIEMRGVGDDTVAEPILHVEQVTIDGSEGGGVSLQSSAAFTAGSTGLTVKNLGPEPDDYPISVTPIAVGSVPVGSYTGNAADAIEVTANLLTVRRDVTVHARGIAYYWVFDQVRLFDLDGGVPTLTIEPGVEMRFDQTLQVGETGNPDSPGVLIAQGTPAEPIVFTSSKADRAAGDWPGVWLKRAGGSKISNLRIEYAGGDNGIVSANCRPPASTDAAGLLVGWDGDKYIPSASDFSAVTISQSAGAGINAMWTAGEFGPDLTSGFTFDGISGCRQTKNWTDSGCQGAEGCLVP